MYSPSLYCILLIDIGEYKCYKEAIQVKEYVKWDLAMNDEMNLLIANNTWQLA